MANPTVNAVLDDVTPDEGQLMRLTVDYGDPDDRSIEHSDEVTAAGGVACKVKYDPVEVSVYDSDPNTSWTSVSDNGGRMVLTAAAKKSATVTATVTDTLGENTASDSVAYTVATATVPPPTTTGDQTIGMSSPQNVWDARLKEVGTTGVTARRIFATLNSSGSSQMDLVKEATDAKMIPVYSFRLPGDDAAGGKSGKYDTWVKAMSDKLVAYDKPMRVVFHHEPYGDISGADFCTLWTRYMPHLKRGKLKVGPFVNGWLLDNKVAEFTSFTTPQLLATWDFMGIDTYESGTMEAPGKIKPADRLPKLLNWLKAQGQASKPIGIGEYNGYSGATIKAAGDAFLACPTLDFACMWNSVAGKGIVLTGDRLAAFKATLADPRTAKL